MKYPMTTLQRDIIVEVQKLPKKKLHYLVIQQNNKYPNLSIDDIKNLIKREVKKYYKNIYPFNYKKNKENEMIKYYCFFETAKYFFQNQNNLNLHNDKVDLKLHFHLFLSSNDNNIHIPQLTNNLIMALLEFRRTDINLSRAINKVDYKRLSSLEDNFIMYHTKQLNDINHKEMILKNI
jgi:hypothetical protein